MKRAVTEFVLVAILLAGIVGTSAALVTTTHESRTLFIELEALKREEDRLQDDWSALWIEVGTEARHARIDEFARRELGMVEPGERLQFLWTEQ
jgi:cell division protein FtsL